MRILYIEDNPMDVELTHMALAKSMPAATIAIASTRAEAQTRLAKSSAFDVVLCDYRLPDGTGLDVLSDIRQNHDPVPVVILTGLGDEDTAVSALKSGADDYVVKRMGYLDELPLVLEHAVEQFQAHAVVRHGGIRVLYVEHNAADADLTLRHMKRHAPHITLEIVPTADAALLKLPTQADAPCPWDVLMLDYRLPGLNALETLKIIRYERQLDIPVIMVTGKGNEELAAKALHLGALDYLVKREGCLSQLPHVIENALNLARLKREQQALRESEARYRRFFEDDLTADFVADAEAHLLDCNPAFLHLFGLETREQALALDVMAFLPDPDMRQLGIEELYKLGKIENYETELKRMDGNSVFVIMNISGVFDDDGQMLRMYGYLFDITERKHFQGQFYQSQKMEALGHLAGGVAHDFNNLLVPILGYAEMGMRNDYLGGKFYADFAQIKAAAERAAQLTRQILAFSRRQVLEMRSLDLNSVIEGFYSMLKRLLTENIELTVSLSPDLAPIRGDKGQLEQVLLNLVVNARDAMPKGGALVISTENVTLDEPYISTHTDVQPGDYVLLAVSDTGKGMDSETQQRIFEPFFSTKERGAGTGLGLSTVFGIIKQHGGNILVYSEPGHGTSFKIYLPVTNVAEKETSVVPDSGVSLYGTETILVVEDDDDVRRLVCVTVQSFGYQVLEAADPMEAIKLVSQNEAGIDLLLTDLIMPGMNGHDLFNLLAATRPKLNVLFMSGYTDDIISQRDGLPNGFHFVQKPFDIQTLLKMIRQALA